MSELHKPAFSYPNPNYDGNRDDRKEIGGLSKLEYAAIQAMSGLVANASIQDNADMGFQEMAEESVNYAKALFDELEADANLIATSSKLYSALERIIAELPSNKDWLDPVLEAEARDALKQARGEQQ